MSDQNVEVVRRGFAAWEQGDLTAFLELMDPGVVCRRLPPLLSGTWHGPEGALELAAEWIEGFDHFSMLAEEYVDAGDQVIVRVAHRGTGSGSGVPVEARFWFVYTVSDGKVTGVDIYAGERQARDAAGLGPR